ncbi:MAG TPA: hypothetical protein VF573_29005 [Paraburkholderia sp.]|uniref:hypothetical protein n=1 Tax=Paraburkholderia sp. TaxID=1926495 RepID=UPI002ED59DCA
MMTATNPQDMLANDDPMAKSRERIARVIAWLAHCDARFVTCVKCLNLSSCPCRHYPYHRHRQPCSMKR